MDSGGILAELRNNDTQRTLIDYAIARHIPEGRLVFRKRIRLAVEVPKILHYLAPNGSIRYPKPQTTKPKLS